MSTACSREGLPAVHVSLGAYGRMPHLLAVAEMLAHPPTDSLLGMLSCRHVQLCPQGTGVFSRDMAVELVETFPDIQWRLHANMRVSGPHRIVDLCDWPREQDYFRELAAVSCALRAPAYSAHAGRRARATVQQVIWHAGDVEQLFGRPVAIEGHYPATRGTPWLFSAWEEYRLLLESGAHYALDLSHLNILACLSGRREEGLVQEMLACERCIEVHLSGNDGGSDQHLPLDAADPPWWYPLLKYISPKATVFYEGRLPTHLRYPAAAPATS